MFFVGTAPLAGNGHINISPKGGQGQQFGVLDERTFWYMDMTGSGVETTAHLHEPGNGRICVMVSSLLFICFAYKMGSQITTIRAVITFLTANL